MPVGNGEEDEEVLCRLLDDTPVTGWKEGVVSAKTVKSKLQEFGRSSPSIPLDVRLAQQRFLVESAREINRVCGPDPSQQVLEAFEDPVLVLRDSIRNHRNYRR